MRIAVVSDIHGNLPALQAVVRDFEQARSMSLLREWNAHSPSLEMQSAPSSGETATPPGLRKGTIDSLVDAARADRIYAFMRPYLEALA